MELKVGVNSYITLEEAESIVANNFLDTDSERVYWNNLNNENKSILIARTTQRVDKDTMLYIGRKSDSFQKMQFPRDIPTSQGLISTECPDSIKIGIVVLALKDASYNASEEGQMVNKGITSFSDGGGLSVHFDTKNNALINGIDRDTFREFFSQYTIVC